MNECTVSVILSAILFIRLLLPVYTHDIEIWVLNFSKFFFNRYVLKVTISRGYAGSIIEYQDFVVIISFFSLSHPHVHIGNKPIFFWTSHQKAHRLYLHFWSKNIGYKNGHLRFVWNIIALVFKGEYKSSYSLFWRIFVLLNLSLGFVMGFLLSNLRCIFSNIWAIVIDHTMPLLGNICLA